MRLTREERADRRASFRNMGIADKIKYLYDYYKLPISLAVIALALLCSAVYRQFTKKEVILYSAHVNVSVGDTLESRLNSEFISSTGANPQKAEVYLYRGLYLSEAPSEENHQYMYASRLKIMASIEATQLDVVLMNQEAYDILSHNGYLLELPDFLSKDVSLNQFLEPYLTSNTVILEDNAVEYHLNEADQYVAITEECVNGIDVSEFSVFSDAGFPDRVYLGVIANSPRLANALQYIEYLTSTTVGTQN